MAYAFPQKVLFKHCDPAGIVFYPRYFEMINDAVEAMFDDLLGWPFETMHPDCGVPTVAFQVEFKAPSRHGDQLVLQVALLSVGGSSLKLRTTALSGPQGRFVADQTLVLVGGNGRPMHWPEQIKTLITQNLEGPDET